MEALVEEALAGALEAAEQGELCQHRPVAAGKIRQQGRLLQDVPGNDAEHMRAPAGACQDLPESPDRHGAVGNARVIGPIPSSSRRLDEGRRCFLERQLPALVVDECSASVREDDIWVRVQY